MADLGSAVFTLITDATPFERGLRAAGAAADASTAGIGKKMGRVGQSFVTAGRSLTRGLTVPMLAVGAISVKLAANYQRDLVMIHTQAGATVKEMKRVDGEIRGMVKRGQTAFSMDELAKAMYHIESLNYHGAKAYRMLSAAQKGASIGNANLEQTTTALGAAILTHIRGLGNYGHAMGMVMATVGQGNMRLQDFVDAMKSGLVPTARAANVDFPSLATALTVVTDRTGSAAVSANRLRTLLLMVAAPTAKAQAALKTLGMTSGQLGLDMQKPNGILVAVKDLAAHLAKLPKAQRKSELQFIAPMFGGSRSTGTMATLLTSIASMEKKFPLINKQSHNFNKEWDATKQTAMWKFHKALVQVEQVLTNIGYKIMPVAAKIAKDLAQKIQSLVNWYDRLSPSGKHLVNTFIEIALVAGPVLMVFGTMLRLLSPLVTGIGFLARAAFGLIGPMVGMGGASAVAGEQLSLFGTEAATATTIGLLPFAAAAAGIVGLGLAYWFMGAHTATDKMSASADRLKGALKRIPDELKRMAGNAQDATGALRHMNDIVKRMPNNIKAIERAQGKYEHILEHGVAIRQGYVKDLGRMHNGVRNIIKASQPYAGQTYKGAVAIGHAADRTRTYQAALGTARDSLQTFIGKMLISHPVLAKSATKALAVANAAYLISQKINGIPTFKQITIQMTVDALINRYVGATGGRPPGSAKPGKPHGATGTQFAPGGLAVVGEQGPELVHLPRSAQMFTAKQTAAMINGRMIGGGGGSAVSRIRIDNWSEGWATIETQTTNAIDHNNRFLRRHG